MTFPAHAAAILPLMGMRRRLLPGTALLVGSVAPDFAFVAGARAGQWSHGLAGLLLFCVPVGIAVYAAFDGTILPAVRGASGRLAQAFPGRPLVQDARGWATVVVALFAGTLTHLSWDALTHADRWPGAVLFTHEQAALSHLVSSWSGSVIVLGWWLIRLWHSTPQHGVQPRALAALLAGIAVGAGLVIAARSAVPSFLAHLPALWMYALGVFIGLFVASFAVRSGANPPAP